MPQTEEEIAAAELAARTKAETDAYKAEEAERVARRDQRDKQYAADAKALPKIIQESRKSPEVQRAERDARVKKRLDDNAAAEAAAEAAKAETPAPAEAKTP